MNIVLSWWPGSAGNFAAWVLHHRFGARLYMVGHGPRYLASGWARELDLTICSPQEFTALDDGAFNVWLTHWPRFNDLPALVLVRDPRDAISSFAGRSGRDVAAMIQSAPQAWSRWLRSWSANENDAALLIRFHNLVQMPLETIGNALAALGASRPLATPAPVPGRAYFTAGWPDFFPPLRADWRDRWPSHIADLFERENAWGLRTLKYEYNQQHTGAIPLPARIQFGSPGPRQPHNTGEKRLRCQHLGDATGQTAECHTCNGAVQLKLFRCAIHSHCTLVKRVNATACCDARCKEYAALTLETKSLSSSPEGAKENVL